MEFMIVFIAFVLGAVLGWWLKSRFEVAPALPSPPERCRTIAYHYDNGQVKVFHSCQGHTEFNDRFGKRFAPRGAKLLKSVGGKHV
jgi:hypothetical protein